MTACNAMQEDLGALLAGALEDGERARVEEHVEGCEVCTCALADLEQLERTLGRLGIAGRDDEVAPDPYVSVGGQARTERARILRGPQRWLLTALAAAAGLLVAALLWGPHGTPPVTGPRLVAGTLMPEGARAADEGLVSSGPVALDRRLVAAEAATVVQADGSVVYVERGAALWFTGPRRVELFTGGAHFHVVRDSEPYVVETPRGSVEVLGTSFRIHIQEGPMGRIGVRKTAGATALVAVGVISGAVLFRGPDGEAVRVDAAERLVAGADGVEVLSLEAQMELEAERADLREEVTALRGEKTDLSDAKEALTAERDELREALANRDQEVERVEQELEALAEATAPPGASGEGAPVSFGEWGELEAIRSADWKAVGEALHEFNDLLPKFLELDASDPNHMAVQIQIAKANQAFQKIAFATNGKLPTHVSGNGEFTHPIVLANMLSEHLAAAGLPLTDGQLQDLARLGDQFDLEWHFAQRGYAEDTIAVAKVLDELRLKKQFTDRAEGLLTSEQLAVVTVPEIYHRFALDVHSPVLLLMGRANVAAGITVEQVRANMVAKLSAATGLPTEEIEVLPGVVDAWMDAVRGGLAPVSKGHVSFFHIDEALASGYAQLQVLEQLRGIAPDDEVRNKILGVYSVIVPRLIASK